MQYARLCSSERLVRLPAALAAIAMLALAGCSTTTSDALSVNAATTQVERKATADTVKTGAISAREKDSAELTRIAASTNESAGPAPLSRSAWCDYLENNANAEAEIIGSPSLAGSADDAGNYSFNIGVNLLDYKKAELVRQTGGLKCRQYTANKVIEATIKLADEAVALRGAVARHQAVIGSDSELSAISSQARNLVSGGALTAQEGDRIANAVRAIRAKGDKARSEIDRRKDHPALRHGEIAGQTRELADSDYELQRIDRQIRTLDAFSLNLEAGYRMQERNDILNAEPASEDVFAKVKVGIRLGALSPRRQQFEDAAASARAASMSEELGGPLWQTEYARSAAAKALPGLREAAQKTQAALNAARQGARNMAASDRPELAAAALAARVEAVSLKAELAALNAAIAEIENNLRRLAALQQ